MAELEQAGPLGSRLARTLDARRALSGVARVIAALLADVERGR